MVIKHVGIVCSSEENSTHFYERLLGLTRKDSKILPRELSRQIFKLDLDLKIINYADDNIHFEVFIDSRKRIENQRIEHVCIEVEDIASFLEKCLMLKINVLKIPKGDKLLVFITDYDGNMFEVKAKT